MAIKLGFLIEKFPRIIIFASLLSGFPYKFLYFNLLAFPRTELGALVNLHDSLARVLAFQFCNLALTSISLIDLPIL